MHNIEELIHVYIYIYIYQRLRGENALADPRNREIDFDFDFDSFVRAGGAKLRGCVGDVILIAGAPAVKFSGFCCSCGFFIFLLLYAWVLSCFVIMPTHFAVIYVGFLMFCAADNSLELPWVLTGFGISVCCMWLFAWVLSIFHMM